MALQLVGCATPGARSAGSPLPSPKQDLVGNCNGYGILGKKSKVLLLLTGQRGTFKEVSSCIYLGEQLCPSVVSFLAAVAGISFASSFRRSKASWPVPAKHFPCHEQDLTFHVDHLIFLADLHVKSRLSVVSAACHPSRPCARISGWKSGWLA